MTRAQKTAVLTVLGLGLMVLAYALRAVITPLLVALLLAYMLHPLLEVLERRGVPRVAGIAGIYAVLLGLVLLFVLVGIPALVAEGAAFVEDVTKPDARIHQLLKKAGEILKHRLGVENWDQMVAALRERLSGHWGDVARTAGNVVTEVLQVATSSVAASLSILGFVALVPVYLFFLLMNLSSWWQGFTRAIPKAVRPQALATLQRIHAANASFFRGQTTIAAIEGLVVFVTLWLAGAKLSLLFGLLYFVLSLVPFVGPFTWLLITIAFTLIDTGSFGGQFWTVIGLFMGIQVLEAAVLQPAILGKETGLHPILITLSLMSFGQIFGIFGVLLAIPLACAVKILFEDYVWPMFAEVAELTAVRRRPDSPPPPPAPPPVNP